MKKLSALLLAFVFVGLTACTSASSSGSGTSSVPSSSQSQASGSSSASSSSSGGGGNAALGQGLDARMTQFAAQTTAALLDGSENACYSPFSLYTALAMLSQGAQGETLDELLALLGAEDPNSLSADCAQMMQTLQFSSEGEGDPSGSAMDESWADPTQLSVANSAWLAQGYAYAPAFSAAVGGTFDATLFEDIDFGDSATAKLAGDWIAQNTGGLLGQNLEFSADTVLGLINTVYLADAWQNSFNEGGNTDDAFYLQDGSTVTTTYMHKTISETYYIPGDNYVGVRLGLSGGTMGFVLPDEGVSVAELLGDEDALFRTIDELSDSKADVVLPLPKFSFDSDYSMIDFLEGLGVVRAFDQDNAQLFGLVEESPNNLFVSQVRQETHIAIDEQGVEAAAYTVIGIEPTAAPMPESIQTVEVILDRPFIFFISYNGIPVFVGVVANPAA